MTSNAWHTLQSSLASSAADIKSALDVRAYFDEHPDMPEVTERICQAARREFGPEVSLTLLAYRDPEIEDEYLLLRVRLPSYNPGTMRWIRSISDPYEDELVGKSGVILVTSDFGPIR